MSDLRSTLLPTRSEVTTEIYDIATGDPQTPFWSGWIIGVQMPNGRYDPRWPPRFTFAEEESWVLAGILPKASGCPVRGVDPTGSAR